MIEPEHAGDGFAIVNASGHDHADGGAEGEEFDFDNFILLRLSGAGTQAFGQVNGHGFGDEARTGIEIQDSLPAGGGEARLLEQFTFGRGQLAFASVNSACAEFPEKLLSGVAILAHQQDAGLGVSFVDCENHNGAGVAYDVATAAHARGLEYLIGGDPEGGATIGFDGRKHASFGF